MQHDERIQQTWLEMFKGMRVSDGRMAAQASCGQLRPK